MNKYYTFRIINMERELISKEICMTKDIGLNGNLFGGIMLSCIDKAGAVFACEMCECDSLVTLTMDKVIFNQPVKVGHILYFYGTLEKFGNTSISIKIEVFRKDYNVDMVQVCGTSMVFVQIDSEGNSSEIISNAKTEYLKK